MNFSNVPLFGRYFEGAPSLHPGLSSAQDDWFKGIQSVFDWNDN